MLDTLLLIPAYNEEENIGELLQKLIDEKIHEEMDILVINDASRDKTAEVVSGFEQIKLITHVYNLGYGSALQLGYRYAKRNGYRKVLQIDADGQHDICNIHPLQEALDTPDKDGRVPDIVIGSRFEKGSVSFPVKGVKLLSIKFFRRIIKMTTGKVIKDPTSGLQGLNRSAIDFYSVYQNFDNDYPDANVIIQMLMLGYTIREIPSVMHPRLAGQSMHSGILKPMLYMMMMPLNILAIYLRLRNKHIGAKAE